MPDSLNASAAEIAAYQDGKRAGLAIAALGLAIVAYINLLNIEKSLPAIVLAGLALRGAATYGFARRWGQSALVIAAAHLILLAVLVSVYHNVFVQLFRLLQKLS
jgi:hypothetical protein